MMSWARGLAATALAIVPVGPLFANELAVVGTGDGAEMLQAVSAAYNAQHAQPKVTIPPSIGSGGAVAAVGADRNQLGRVARPLTEAEKAQGLSETPLVRIPSVFFAHPDAGVKSLTSEQLVSIFSGQIENWKDVGGADLRVRLVRREETDSTLSVLRATMPGWKNLALASKSKVATTTQEAVEAVKRVPGAVGFGPYSRALDEGTNVLAIDGKAPHASDYPSSVTLSLIYKNDKVNQGSRDFLAFLNSEIVRKVLTADGGIPLAR